MGGWPSRITNRHALKLELGPVLSATVRVGACRQTRAIRAASSTGIGPSRSTGARNDSLHRGEDAVEQPVGLPRVEQREGMRWFCAAVRLISRSERSPSHRQRRPRPAAGHERRVAIKAL